VIAVIFEVTPKPGSAPAYFDTAAALRPLLDEIDGFISVERFESLTRPGTFLSLSYFRDEPAVQQWRQRMEHRGAQNAGRERLFADYRLRVASVIRDYGLTDREQAPPDAADR